MARMRTFGEVAREIRGEYGWSAQRLADEAGLHRNTVVTVELGYSSPSEGTMRAIASALGVPLAQMLEDAA